MGKESQKQYLTPLGAWALAFGSAVGWGAFVMPGTTFLPIAGPLGTVLGMGLGAVVMLIIGVNYHYMMQRFPEAGGAYSFTVKVIGYDHGFLSAWFLVLVYIAIMWANMTAIVLVGRNILGSVFAFGFHYQVAGYDVYLGEILIELLALLLCGAFCYFRKRIAGMVQTVCALILIVGITAVFLVVMARSEGISGLAPAFSQTKTPVFQIYNIMALAPWAFIGFENISHSVEEFKFSVKRSFLPLAGSVAAGFFAYSALVLVATAVRPERYADWYSYIRSIGRLDGIESMPVFHAVHLVLGNGGIAALGVVLLCAILTGLIGNMIALSRLLCAMGRDHVLPEWFAGETKEHTPGNAILFIVAISLAIPFMGRTPIGWIVDVTTVGATVAYGFTSASAGILAKQEHNRGVQITGIIGMLMSDFFSIFLLVPNLWSVSSLAAESYLILAFWGVAGFVLFRYVFIKDKEQRFGKSTVVWVVLLFLVFFTSLLWQRQATHVKTLEVIDEISDYYSNSMAAEGVELTLHELRTEEIFLEKHMGSINTALMNNSIVQLFLIVVGLYILFNVYSMMQVREREMEEQKHRAEANSRAKTTFLSNMSHDIRTPMNAIIGYVNLAKEDDNDAEALRGYLGKIESSSHHLLALINDVLEMSRIESGKMELETVDTDLEQMMDAVREMFATQMKEKNIDYTVTCENLKNRAVCCDRNRMNRVLLNLISNAYKFTPENGKVAVRLVQTGLSEDGRSADYEISVKDTGIGMTEEFAEKVFEAFERERTSTVSGIQGTGLGMAITKNIVDMMGGTITVNTAPGEGAEFVICIQFVLGDEKILEKKKKALKTAEGKVDFAGRRVLLVEDMDVNREIAARLLGRMGFEVEQAINGQEAVDKVAQNAPGYYDAVLMDIQMPVMDGYDAARGIRALPDERRCEVPIVAMTANAFSEDVQKAIDAGMNAHVAKPIDVKILTATLSEILLGGGVGTPFFSKG